jgi:ABC-type phosphate transport system substrate-binding protein
MRALSILILALVLTVPAVEVVARGASPPPPYVIIVHPSNPTTGISRKFLVDAFLKKTTRWEHGEVIRPADQPADSAVRRKFSEEILKRSVAAVRSFWQQAVFSGRDVPPPELNTDEDVVKYVANHAGAVGYVSGTATIDGAKVMPVN